MLWNRYPLSQSPEQFQNNIALTHMTPDGKLLKQKPFPPFFGKERLLLLVKIRFGVRCTVYP